MKAVPGHHTLSLPVTCSVTKQSLGTHSAIYQVNIATKVRGTQTDPYDTPSLLTLQTCKGVLFWVWVNDSSVIDIDAWFVTMTLQGFDSM